MCDTCKERGTCPFYESGAEECVYEEILNFAFEEDNLIVLDVN